MATFRVESDGEIIARMAGQSRETIRRIVMAGSSAAEQRMRENTERKRHVRNHDMLDSVGNSGYNEFFQGGSTYVYPQGDDRKGVRNATKAYVINYGRGGVRRRGRMGDRFITGDEKNTEAAVVQAMQAENDRIMDEINKE